jgi:translation elongation factor EF-G
MVGARAILYDGSYHVEDSNEMAFKIAASMAFKEAARKPNPVILEPLMLIEVVTPEDFAAVIMGDLSFRRGRIEGMEIRAGSLVINALVPLVELIGYATLMRSSTQGRASYSMNFARYEDASHVGDSGAEEPVLWPIDPKVQLRGGAMPLPSRIQNRSDREFSVPLLALFSVYEIRPSTQNPVAGVNE